MKSIWLQYIDFAIELSARPDEPALRSSISRAYYGTFCYSRNYLTNTGKIKSTANRADIHRQVIDCLSLSDDAEESIAGQHLDNLRKKEMKQITI